ADRMARVVELAAQDAGAAVGRGQLDGRDAVLRALAAAVRDARLAAYNVRLEACGARALHRAGERAERAREMRALPGCRAWRSGPNTIAQRGGARVTAERAPDTDTGNGSGPGTDAGTASPVR